MKPIEKKVLGRITVALLLAVCRQSVRLGAKPLEAHFLTLLLAIKS
jgi:hypothetical protein